MTENTGVLLLWLVINTIGAIYAYIALAASAGDYFVIRVEAKGEPDYEALLQISWHEAARQLMDAAVLTIFLSIGVFAALGHLTSTLFRFMMFLASTAVVVDSIRAGIERRHRRRLINRITDNKAKGWSEAEVEGEGETKHISQVDKEEENL